MTLTLRKHQQVLNHQPLLNHQTVLAVLKQQPVLAVLRQQTVLAVLKQQSVLAVLKQQSVLAVLKQQPVLGAAHQELRWRGGSWLNTQIYSALEALVCWTPSLQWRERVWQGLSPQLRAHTLMVTPNCQHRRLINSIHTLGRRSQGRSDIR
jgi:hypothetical protein